jgi:beta-1,4-mannosyltransferase
MRTQFIIDWHNYGFTIMALKSGPENILVKICKKFEVLFGQKSNFNICVTSAMKNDLANYGIKATTMYDKPHEGFRKMTLSEKNNFYSKLTNTYGISCLTEMLNGQQRPALLVSSSSWTEDEDFQLLIDAFDIYQMKKMQQQQLPEIVCFLTGKGPLKQYYQDKFEEKSYKNIKVIFLWLEIDDYPSLLGACDLGVCFHKSSSNLDLPMKVVDMFGARLPVCALDFTCISELVKDNSNGLLFSTANELASHLIKLLVTLNEKNSRLETFRDNLETFSTWDQEWKSKVKPMINLI